MHHEIHGRTDPAAPTVLLCSGLGGAAHYWTRNLPALCRHFRVIAYDQRGTGKSPGALPRGYSISDMASEAADLLKSLGVRKCHLIGHALGGLIGLQLALDQPSLIDRLVVINAWAKTHPHTIRCFAARKSLLLHDGAAAYVAAQPLFLYPAWWLADRQTWLAEQDAAAIAHFPPREAVLQRIAAIEAFDIEVEAATIETQALVIASRDDMLVPATCSERLAGLLPNASPHLFQQGGHACNITNPEAFETCVHDYLAKPHA